MLNKRTKNILIANLDNMFHAMQSTRDEEYTHYLKKLKLST